MPIQVDLEARAALIADATVKVAATRGLSGVTIRSVAAELGASTTFITNYLPTRAALLLNALREIEGDWLAELEEELAGMDAESSLRRAMQRAVEWNDEERLRAQFWIAVLAVPDRGKEIDRHLHDSTAAVKSVMSKLIDRCGHPHPEAAAEFLVLVAQGAFVSIVETPDLWSEDKLFDAVDRAVDAVLAGVD